MAKCIVKMEVEYEKVLPGYDLQDDNTGTDFADASWIKTELPVDEDSDEGENRLECSHQDETEDQNAEIVVAAEIEEEELIDGSVRKQGTGVYTDSDAEEILEADGSLGGENALAGGDIAMEKRRKFEFGSALGDGPPLYLGESRKIFSQSGRSEGHLGGCQSTAGDTECKWASRGDSSNESSEFSIPMRVGEEIVRNYISGGTLPHPQRCRMCDRTFNQCDCTWKNLIINKVSKYNKFDTVERPFSGRLLGHFQWCRLCKRPFSVCDCSKPHLKAGSCKSNNSDTSVITTTAVEKHPEKKLLDRPYKCQFCNKEFRSRSNLKSHELVVHVGHRPHQCNICEKSFKQPQHLKRHQRMHTGEIEPKPHECSICSKAFNCRTKLKHHAVVHSDLRPYKCDICGKAFKLPKTLKQHQLIHLPEHVASSHKLHKCDICGRAFNCLSALKQHWMIHSGDKPYKCNICEKTFRQLGHLNQHQVLHSGHRPHECDICEKTFNRASHLKQHRWVHSGEKPYHCDICEKKFRDSSGLRRHKMVHSVKPYQCTICSRAFTQQLLLKKHEKIHTETKPYQCDICQRRFSRSSDLKKHEVKHFEQGRLEST